MIKLNIRIEIFKVCKIYGIGISLVFAFFCQQLWALDGFPLSKIVNMKFQGELPPIDASLAQDRMKALLNFVETDVFPQIPSPILEVVRTHAVTIILSESLSGQSGAAELGELVKTSDNYPGQFEIYLRPSILMSEDAKQLLAHSYFHVVHYILHPEEENWVREGLAQFFEYKVLGRFNAANIRAAFLRPSTSLLEDYNFAHIDPALYGHDLLYFMYLNRECANGSDNLFWTIAKGSPRGSGIDTGIDTINFALNSVRKNLPALAQKQQCQDFASSARDFEIARFLNHQNYSTGGKDENSTRYLLYATTLKTAAPLEQISQEQIDSLAPYQPLLLSPLLELQSDKDMIHLWIEKAYPYAAQEASPDFSDGTSIRKWQQLIFKTH